jgi:hypothetical protein
MAVEPQPHCPARLRASDRFYTLLDDLAVRVLGKKRVK